jgi:hypothetical protein
VKERCEVLFNVPPLLEGSRARKKATVIAMVYKIGPRQKAKDDQEE